MSDQQNPDHCGPAAPGPEHAELLKNVGDWDIVCHYFIPGQEKPMEAKATESVRALGGFWTVSDFRVEMPGFKLTGSATVGYDPKSKKHVAFWVDSGNPWAQKYEGERDQATGVLEMRGENPDPGTGILTKFRTQEKRTGPDTREFSMWYQPPGHPELKLALYRYTRRK